MELDGTKAGGRVSMIQGDSCTAKSCLRCVTGLEKNSGQGFHQKKAEKREKKTSPNELKFHPRCPSYSKSPIISINSEPLTDAVEKGHVWKP